MKRLLCTALVLLMLLSSMMLMFSCKKEGDDKKTGGNQQVQYDENTIFYERAQVSDDLPDKDFGGKTLRVVTHMPDEIIIPDDEQNKGNLINDAKVTRNTVVMDRFNANIEVTYTGEYTEVSNYVRKTVLAGNDEFDLLMGMAIETGNLVKSDLFLNWYNIEHINFDKPWWAESNKTDLTYDQKCPLAVSDLNFSSITSTFCMLFNKNLAASYELGNIYDLVLNGEWTFDAMYELIKEVYEDDGNDVRDQNDFYGMAHSNGSSLNTYLWAFDNPVCKKDEDGVPQIAIKTDKIDNIVNDLYDLVWNSGAVYFDTTAESGTSYPMDMFLAKKCIFVTSQIGYPTGEGLRNFEDDYGLIPYPKYDENQKEYHTMADGYHSVLAVPKTCHDTEFVGIMVEALSAESWKTVTPTLYEIALKSRYLRDDESKEVLDLIIKGRVFDFGYIYDGFQGFSFTLQRMLNEGNNNFQSEYDRIYSSARTQYKKIVKALDKID